MKQNQRETSKTRHRSLLGTKTRLRQRYTEKKLARESWDG